MERGFWEKLNKPIFALAPMADVTDATFRQIIAQYGKPDVMWTEFVSCDGLCSAGRKNLLIDLKYSEAERPIVAQFFGATPKNFYICAKLAVELGFDGIDINMGCPDKNVVKQGAGAGLIRTPKLAQEIIYETKRGAGKLPVSVKTRAGDIENTISKWLLYLLETNPVAITIHARTRKELSLVPARWDIISEAVKINREYYGLTKEKTLILGNGDVKNLEEAEERIMEIGADGIMFGRGIFGNPFLFNKKNRKISIEEKLRVMIEHTKLFQKMFFNKKEERWIKNFDIMKKHYKAYMQGFDGAKELRVKCMEAKNADEVEKIIMNFKTLNKSKFI